MVLFGHPLCLNFSGVIPQAFLLLQTQHFNTKYNITAQFQHNYLISFLVLLTPSWYQIPSEDIEQTLGITNQLGLNV